MVDVPVMRLIGGRRVALAAIGEAAALAGITLVALALRLRALNAPFWIDEGLSVGIAGHPLRAIPGLLLQDGSPPLYYVLLHVWMGMFGESPHSTHVLSALFGTAAVPAAYWAALPAGRRAALFAMVLVAFDPFAREYSDETRMYALALLLTLVVTGAFARAYVLRRRRMIPVFGVALALLLLTHNWALFVAAGCAAALGVLAAIGPEQRALLRDGVLGFGLAGILFAPWVPTLLRQVATTGAPWSHRPDLGSLRSAVEGAVGGRLAMTVLALIAAAGIVLLIRRAPAARARLGCAILGVACVTVLAAWAWSRWHAPAWALRYLVVVLAPLAVALAIGLAELPGLGPAALVVVVLGTWHAHPSIRQLDDKSNVTQVTARVESALPRGSIVFSPQPEQVTNLWLHLPNGLRYLTPLGFAPDPGVMDWRHAMARLDAARYGSRLAPVLDAMRPGQRLFVAQPVMERPDAPWTRRIHVLAKSWLHALRRRGDLRLLRHERAEHHASRSTIEGYLFERRAGGGPQRTIRAS